MSYSRRELYAMGEPLGESVTRKEGGRIIYGSGGGGGPTNSTVTQSNIPDWLRPQVENVLMGAGKNLFQTRKVTDPATGQVSDEITGTRPFTPYSSDPSNYVAGFSPLQQQVQYNAANLQMPGQYNQATGYANVAARGGMGTAAQGAGYGGAGFQSGQMGQEMGAQTAQQAAQRAAMGEQAGYGYGAQGQQSGQIGQQTGMQGGQMGIQGGAQYGQMGTQAGMQGQQSGLMGQQTGMRGGEYYGGMGANMGQQASGLAGAAQGYGQAGYGSGQIGQQLALDASQRYGAMGSGYGASAAALAPQAQQYGQSAADIGRMGLRAESLGQDITGQARGYAAQQAAAGQNYARQMTDPSAIQQYMNPYQSAVTDVQIQGAQRQADIAAQGRKSAAARAGAFGGSRQAIENAEANRALASQMDAIRAQGQQAAYDKAVQAMQYGSNLGLQGLGGAQSGLGTALQGGQLGLSGIGQAMAGQQAGISGLNQAGNLYGLGMQGAGMGLQAAQTGLQGTAQGMQGAQAGLSGVNAANQAYQTGIQGAGMGLQGVNAQLAGTAQGMQGAQAAMQGAGVGLSGVDRQLAGVDRQLAGTAQGMQGAGVGLSGVDRALASGQLALQGTDRGLAGTAQGMQGAQVGLQGVGAQQAGYGMANTAANTLGQLGTQQLAAQTGILGLQNQIGGQQQSQQQQIINQAIQNYSNAQNAPMDAFNQYNALLRGYALPGTTTTQYQAQPTIGNQIAGFGTAGVGALALNNALTPR
jgi:hypothetical protein